MMSKLLNLFEMNIYLVSQTLNNDYDTFDSMVVVAPNEIAARQIHPSKDVTHVKNGKWMATDGDGNSIQHRYVFDDWVRPDQIDMLIVTCIGVATVDQKQGVILASFRAG
jgi:hypothetical protein